MSKYSMTLHHGSILLRCVIGCSLLLIPVLTYASDATGSIRFASCSLTETYRLELVRFKQQKLAKAIVIRFLPLHFWRIWRTKKSGLRSMGRNARGRVNADS
jgi:hypothetical protein